MATGPRYKVAFRRRRELRTDYYARKKLLTARETRAVVRRSNRNISIQFADFAMEGDKIIASASTKELKAMGWEYSCSSVPAAYLVGFLAGKRAIKEGVEYAVLDIGMQKVQHGGVLFATVAGMIEAGLEIPCSEDVLPEEDRLKGKHIDDAMEAAIDSIKQKMEAD
jgi:large subunit ribosomal protein L18